MTHPITGARYPAPLSAPNGPQNVKDLNFDLSTQVLPRFATSSARDTAFSTWTAAGNTMAAGMECFTQSDGRFWRWSVSAGAWVYSRGNPPPIVAATIAGGWSAVGGQVPGAYKDASGLVHLVGALTNTTTYNPNVSATMMTLPTGYRPATTAVLEIPAATVMVTINVNTDGTVVTTTSASTSIGSGSGHWFGPAAPFHLTYAGTVPLA